uniref:Uncharacterized protein n=1 Tax=Sphaerodactylus townsendi TaxID=933632 RepID=A0ACB8E7U4_9SAUR
MAATFGWSAAACFSSPRRQPAGEPVAAQRLRLCSLPQPGRERHEARLGLASLGCSNMHATCVMAGTRGNPAKKANTPFKVPGPPLTPEPREQAGPGQLIPQDEAAPAGALACLANTPVSLPAMLPWLARYPNRQAARYLHEGFLQGFRIPYTGPRSHDSGT